MVNIHCIKYTHSYTHILDTTDWPAHMHTPTLDLFLSQIADDFFGELRAGGIPSQVFGHMLVTCTSHVPKEGIKAKKNKVKREEKWKKVLD